MKSSMKTTLMGVAAALCYLGYKFLAKVPITGEDITLALGLVGIGAVAKDSDVTGGTKPRV